MQPRLYEIVEHKIKNGGGTVSLYEETLIRIAARLIHQIETEERYFGTTPFPPDEELNAYRFTASQFGNVLRTLGRPERFRWSRVPL